MKRNYVNTYGITEDTVITDELVLTICLRDNGTKMKSGVTAPKWLKQHPRLTDYLLNRYQDSDNLKETLYRMKNCIEKRPTCSVCGGHVHFHAFNKGFPKHCSTACLNKDPEHIQKIKETCNDRYGGNNPMCSEEIKTSRNLHAYRNMEWNTLYRIKKFGTKVKLPV